MKITTPGFYRLTEDVTTRGTWSIGTLPRGTVIEITQVDAAGGKVIGPHLADWRSWDMPAEMVPNPIRPVAPSPPETAAAPESPEDDPREREYVVVQTTVEALAHGEVPTCECGNDAVCVGVTEGRLETLAVMCEECCGHGNEDGWCVPLEKFYPSKRRVSPARSEGETAPVQQLSALRFSAHSLPPEVRMPMTGTPVRTVLLALIDEVEAARSVSPAERALSASPEAPASETAAPTFFDRRAADTLAREVAKLVDRGVIDARSPAGDALLDYVNPGPMESIVGKLGIDARCAPSPSPQEPKT